MWPLEDPPHCYGVGRGRAFQALGIPLVFGSQKPVTNRRSARTAANLLARSHAMVRRWRASGDSAIRLKTTWPEDKSEPESFARFPRK